MEKRVRKNVKNEGTVRLFSLTDELFRIISSKQRRKHVHHGIRCWWTCLLRAFSFQETGNRTLRLPPYLHDGWFPLLELEPLNLRRCSSAASDRHHGPTHTHSAGGCCFRPPSTRWVHPRQLHRPLPPLTPAHFTSSICFSSLLRYCHCCIVLFCSANLELCYLFAEGQLC